MSGIGRLLGRLDVELFVVDRRWLLGLASTLVASNLVVNTLVAERLFSPDGHLVPGTKSFIFGYHAVSLVLGFSVAFLAARLRTFQRRVKLHHALVALITIEFFLRLTVFTDVVSFPPLENPRLYSLGSCGDDGYFVLRHYYDRDPPRGSPHPTLGWVRGVGELGIITDEYMSMNDIDKQPVLFFGDSFVGWGEPMNEKLPQLLDARLDAFNVLNFGVPGYATDQISLRAQREVPKFESMRPVVLIGVLLDDLDRALLKYRLSQKPYYELTDGELTLHTPRYRTNAEFFDAFHFHGKSFAASPFLALIGKLFRAEEWCSARRRELNLAIFEDLVSFLRSRRIEHHFVVFYSQNDLGRTSAMETELESIFDEIGIENVVDTKQLLLAHLDRTGAARTSLYDDGGAGHHTLEARTIIADGIATYLAERSSGQRFPGPDRGE